MPDEIDPRQFRPEVYAIDFGTTNSLLAAARSDAVHPPIPLDHTAADATVLRSLLYFPDSTQCFHGAAAVREYVERGMQGRLIRSLKKHLPSRAFIGTHVEERPMNLEDLIGAFLVEMRARADRYFDAEVTKVVLGRPARFSSDGADDAHAQYRLERAAKIAGFREVAFCPEPVAAAREFRKTLLEPRMVLVADFGGGTSDFTVLRMRHDAYDERDVLAIGGVSVAGDALDSAIMRDHVARQFGSEVSYRVPMGNNHLRMPPALMEKICHPADASLLRSHDAMRFLRDVRGWALSEADKRTLDQLFILVEDCLGFQLFEAIELAKRTLSEVSEAHVEFEYPGVEVHQPLSRPAFDRSAGPATRAVAQELDATLARAGIAAAEIDIVCCTGGTARVPTLAAALEQRFGPEKLTRFQAFHSVIRGLAEHARGMC